ncbi:MAG: PKD domain-containing protein, partial [Methanobacterium sp.]
EGDTVSFNGSFVDPGLNDTQTITWDFGDGTTATGILNPTHVYTDNGTYDVILTVVDKDGGVDTSNLVITVKNVAPMVNAGQNQTVNEGDTVSFNGGFTDPGLNDIQTILWDFGDGTTATGILTPTHKYANDGTYNVTLTVTDNDGGIGTSNLVVTVKPAVIKPISAAVNIDPDTLNLNSKGKWVTAYITLPKGYNIRNVDADTIKLQYGGKSISAAKVTVECGVLVVKFDRAKVQSLFSKPTNNATITVTGKVLYNGSYVDFAGSDTIKVTDKGYCNLEKWFKSLFDLLGDILTI